MSETRHQEPSWQEDLPSELRTLFGEHNWEAVTIGQSGMHVLHIGDGYLKVTRQGQAAEGQLKAEKERLEWLQGKLPVPCVYYYGNDTSFEYLYLSEICGTMACDQVFREDMSSLIRLLAEALHMVHAVDITNCPFERSLQSQLDAIRHKIYSGQIDLEKFAVNHPGLSPQAWYEQLERMRPASDDLAFTHGDFCLPNIIINRQNMCISGFIDWGLGGVADRHRDLDAACWSLGYNFDISWIPSLLEAYGLESIDREKLAFYQLLDDLTSYV